MLKYLLSSAEVKFRPPYGKTIKQFRRYTSFIGTTNETKPLVDPTGSRRFVCVGITPGKNIDFEDNLNHQQLFAQVRHLFESGERYWLNDEEISTLIRYLKSRYANYDPKTSFEKLGRSLNNQQFDFETVRKNSGHIYYLKER